MCIFSCFKRKEKFNWKLIFVDMSIYRYIVNVFLSIYRYHQYAKWRIIDSTNFIFNMWLLVKHFKAQFPTQCVLSHVILGSTDSPRRFTGQSENSTHMVKKQVHPLGYSSDIAVIISFLFLAGSVSFLL